MCVHRVSTVNNGLDSLIDMELMNSIKNGAYISPDDIESISGIRVMHVNIQSTAAKHQEVLNLLTELNDTVDVMLFCETFLTEVNATNYEFASYNSFHKIRASRGGGCSVFVKEGISYVCREDISLVGPQYECAFIEIIRRKPEKNIIIGEVYRRPNTTINEFLTWYESMLCKIQAEGKLIIIGTDHNLNLLDCSKPYIQRFIDSSIENGIIPSIAVPTRVTHSTATLIDNIFVSLSFHNVTSHVLDYELSDHKACMITIPIERVSKDRVFKSRKLNDKGICKIAESLQKIDWLTAFDNKSLDEKTDLLVNALQTNLDKHCPVTEISESYQISSPAWIDKEICELIKTRNKLFKKRKDPDKFIEYKKLRNEIQRKTRVKKKDFFKKRIQKYKNDSNILWGLINNAIRKPGKKSELCNEFLIDGIITTDQKLIANKFCNLYRDFAKTAIEKVSKKGKVKTLLKQKPERIIQECMFFHPPTSEEISRLILSLKNKRSSGYDGISNTLLKRLYPSIELPLNIIYTESLSNGIFPEAMKKAIIKPLYKKDSKLEPMNYRPISLLLVISKILEKLVYVRLTKWIVKNQVMYDGQYGFRENRSTTDAVTDGITSVLNAIENNHICIIVFLDMSRAFDSLSHTKLLTKLSNLGVRGVPLQWFRSYLENRTIVVDFKGTLSNEATVTRGTAQGSNLGPLLYILFTNNLVRHLTYSEGIMFADDTTLICTGRNLSTLCRKLTQDLNMLHNYFIENELCLNTEKTFYLVVNGPKGQKAKLSIAGERIQESNYGKFLGITIDNKLTWGEHVENVIRKLRSGLGALKLCKNFLPSTEKILVYNALFTSHLQYSLSVWGSMISKKNHKRLQVLQNRAIRLVFDLHSRANVESIMKKYKLPKLESLINISINKLMFRISKNLISKRVINKFSQMTKSSHSYNTRHAQDPNIPIHKSHKFSTSYLVKGPSLWSNTKQTVKNSTSASQFKNRYKQSMWT